MSLDDVDARIRHVKDELVKIRGPKKSSADGTWVMIACPFHNDKSPSGRISHNVARPRSVGWYRCYACNDPMPWSTFAERTGLQPFGPPPDSMDVPKTSVAQDDDLLGEGAAGRVLDLTFFDLDKAGQRKLRLTNSEWRGFSIDFLRSVGAKGCTDSESGRSHVYFPVRVSGQEVGFIRALPHKVAGVSSYFNKPGRWASTQGLFLYDDSVTMMLKSGLETLVVVEGPRDALRLLRDGIPAVAILGTNTWTTIKALKLAASGASRLILCLDGDDAGRKATYFLRHGVRHRDEERTSSTPPQLRELFQSFKVFKLWAYAERDGVDEYDAGNMPEDILEDLRSLVI